MDRQEQYRRLVEDIIKEYGSIKPSYGDIEFETIIDRERDHYELMSVGWNDYRRQHGCILHVDIKGGKIWIQHDGTEEGIANRLVALGVPKEHIVLAFHAPYKRPYTGFATN
jgi:hypothetical protein